MSFTRALRAVGAAAAAGALLFVAAPTASADQVRNDQWALSAFAAEKVWSEATGKGVTVAVIDNGFKTNHPDLTGQFLKGKNLIEGGSSVAPDMGEDKPEHGTAMASVIAGHGHGSGNASGVKGLAPDAKILPIRDRGASGTGFFGPAIRYAVDHGADVINISQVVGPSGDPSEDVLGEQEAIQYAVDHGVPVVAGSGNDGEQIAASSTKYPAAEPGVVTVGAIDDQGNIWGDSNYGPQVMLAAPGVKNVVAGLDSDGYDLGTGTSSSTAYTSAALALLKQKFPDLSAGQLVNRLVKTAGVTDAQKNVSLPNDHYGYGIIKPYSALTEDIPAGPKNGPLKVDELNSAIAKAKGSGASAPSSSAPDATSDSGGMSTGLVIGIAAGALVVLVIVVVVIVLSRKKNGGGPPPPPGGGWGGGGHQPYPTQQPYQGSYPQQAPPAPGSYPQAPTQPPYGQ